nr:S-layer homology domain-containing protein [Sedimentibacter sp.]
MNKILRVISFVVVFCFTFTFAVFAAPHNKLPYGQAKKLSRYNFDYNISANFMKDRGIIKGYGNGEFGFDDYVKRGDITVMIVRAFNINTIINKYVEDFDDVEYDSYYYDAIVAAKSYGIARGNGKFFSPKKYVTIGEAIMLIERSAAAGNIGSKVKDVDLEDLYDDSELDEYATRSDIANMLYYVLTGDEYDKEEDEDIDNIDAVEYTIKENTLLTFDDDKLIYEFEDETDEDFDYVKFTLPSTSYGKLYYDYKSSTNYDSLVKSTTKYYDDYNPNISDVTFIPKTNYTGTVSIKYTAYDEDGDSYLGTIKIIIEENNFTLDDVKYTIKENTNFTFDEEDFEGILEHETDNDLNYVRFILPSKYEGKLYYDYSETSNYKSVVAESVKYFVDSSKYLSKVTFVPYTDFNGTVDIDYIAYDDEGISYNGTVKITVKAD